jgi:hypothetical protein
MDYWLDQECHRIAALYGVTGDGAGSFPATSPGEIRLSQGQVAGEVRRIVHEHADLPSISGRAA